MKDELKVYVDRDINFKLKDFDTTQAKYTDYKPQEFNQFLKDSSQEIEGFLLWLDDNILKGLNEDNFYNNTYDNKRSIRGLVSPTNSITTQLINDFIKGQLENSPNNNTIKNFSILFYLKYYNHINEIMKEVLKVKTDYE